MSTTIRKYKLYLSGPSKHLKDEGKGWRNEVKEWMNNYFQDVDVFSPPDYYDYSFLTPPTDKECRKLFIHHLKSSDVILVNLDETYLSPGTSYEVGVANEIEKPIIGFGNKNVYAWTADACDVIFKDWHEAINYIMINYFYYAK